MDKITEKIEEFLNSGEATKADELLLDIIKKYYNDVPLIFMRRNTIMELDDGDMHNTMAILSGDVRKVFKMLLYLMKNQEQIRQLFYAAVNSHMCYIDQDEREKKIKNSLEFARYLLDEDE